MDPCVVGGMVRKYSGADSSNKVAGCKSEGCQEWKKKRYINAEIMTIDVCVDSRSSRSELSKVRFLSTGLFQEKKNLSS